MHSLLGAHHTLVKRGNFMAWNFSKATDPDAEVQLMASYSGAGHRRFTTQALLLKSKTKTMEITAEDCTWRAKNPGTGWRKAKSGVGKDGQVPTLQLQGEQFANKNWLMILVKIGFFLWPVWFLLEGIMIY